MTRRELSSWPHSMRPEGFYEAGAVGLARKLGVLRGSVAGMASCAEIRGVGYSTLEVQNVVAISWLLGPSRTVNVDFSHLLSLRYQ